MLYVTAVGGCGQKGEPQQSPGALEGSSSVRVHIWLEGEKGRSAHGRCSKDSLP